VALHFEIIHDVLKVSHQLPDPVCCWNSMEVRRFSVLQVPILGNHHLFQLFLKIVILGTSGA
jgi:hypothetical protein